MKKGIFLTYFLLVFMASFPTDARSQCAMCKAITKSNNDSGKNEVGKGINRGVLYLLSVPYLLAGIGIVIWLRNRNRSTENGEIQNPGLNSFR